MSGEDALADAADESGYLKIGSRELGVRDLAPRTPLRPLGEPMHLGFDAASATVAVARGVDFVPASLRGSTGSLFIDRPFSVLATGWSGISASARVVYVYAFADQQAAADATPSVEATSAPDNVVATSTPGDFPTPVDENPLTMGSILEVESIETVGRTVVVAASPATDVVAAGYVAPFLVHE